MLQLEAEAGKRQATDRSLNRFPGDFYLDRNDPRGTFSAAVFGNRIENSWLTNGKGEYLTVPCTSTLNLYPGYSFNDLCLSGANATVVGIKSTIVKFHLIDTRKCNNNYEISLDTIYKREGKKGRHSGSPQRIMIRGNMEEIYGSITVFLDT